jgi:hypothetical protein
LDEGASQRERGRRASQPRHPSNSFV